MAKCKYNQDGFRTYKETDTAKTGEQKEKQGLFWFSRITLQK